MEMRVLNIKEKALEEGFILILIQQQLCSSWYFWKSHRWLILDLMNGGYSAFRRKITGEQNIESNEHAHRHE